MLFGLVLLARAGVTFVHNINQIKLQMKSCYDFKMEILQHLRKISLLTYQKFEPLYLAERLQRDTRELSIFFSEYYVLTFLKIFLLLAYIIIIGSLSRVMLYCILVIIPLYIGVYWYYKNYIHEVGFSLREEESKSIQAYVEQLLLMEEIKTEANYEVHNRYVNKKFDYFFGRLGKYLLLDNKYTFSETCLSIIFQVILFGFSAKAIIEGKLTIGGLIIISTYFQMIVEVINYYVNEAIMYQMMKISYKRIQELLDIPATENGNLLLEKVDNIVADFTFAYGAEDSIGKQYKFVGEKGHAYAVVGKNGSGKSTFLKALTGILPLEKQGKIEFNHQPLDNLDVEQLRCQKIGFLTQKNVMTDKTVEELFKEVWPEATLRLLPQHLVCLKAIDSLYAINVVHQYWQKLYKELSEGEKQIIAFIRLLLKNPDVLVLDEPTASLDVERRAWLAKVLDYVKEKKIVLLISHDQEMVELCDVKMLIERSG